MIEDDDDIFGEKIESTIVLGTKMNLRFVTTVVKYLIYDVFPVPGGP
jgi:hypothetical protein